MYASNDWDSLSWRGEGKTFKVNELGPEQTAVCVEFNSRPVDHYDEPIQGEDECSIIFKVGDRYFKKTGHQSSYDEVYAWTGPVVEVFPEEKTVLTFRSKR